MRHGEKQLHHRRLGTKTANGHEEQVRQVAQWLRDAASVAVLTGAGISTESGIPDFRGPRGVWTKNPEAVRYSTLHAYMSDPDVRKRAWQMRMSHPAWTAEPNQGHVALARLEREGHLDCLITQNIDGLHQQAGNSADVVVELHGTLHEVMCMQCGERSPMRSALERVRAGEEDPACRSCAGILKSATVSFGQSLDPRILERAWRAASSCDVLLVVGSSLSVYPAAHLPEVALAAGARLAIVNEEQTPYDERAWAVVRGGAGAALTLLVSLVAGDRS